LYDELRQQAGKKDGFRQTDKTVANLRRRHHRRRSEWQIDSTAGRLV